MGHVRFDDYKYDLKYLKKYYMDMYSHLTKEEWASLFFENHDNPRMISKITDEINYRERVGKLISTLLLTLCGTPFIYQGQELGMLNQDFKSIEDFRDIESVNKYNELIQKGLANDEAMKVILAGSRDHARVFIPWQEDINNKNFWINSFPKIDITDKSEMNNESSIYNWYKNLIAYRKLNNTLIYGDLRFVYENKDAYLAYYREDSSAKFFVEINLTDKDIKRYEDVDEYKLIFSNISGHNLRMKPYETNIYKIQLQ